MTDTNEMKKHAAKMLKRYDAMRKEMRALERELHKTVTEYGKATGRWGFNKDHFRIQLEMEKEGKRAA